MTLLDRLHHESFNERLAHFLKRFLDVIYRVLIAGGEHTVGHRVGKMSK